MMQDVFTDKLLVSKHAAGIETEPLHCQTGAAAADPRIPSRFHSFT